MICIQNQIVLASMTAVISLGIFVGLLYLTGRHRSLNIIEYFVLGVLYVYMQTMLTALHDNL